jgi:hypothetical protein
VAWHALRLEVVEIETGLWSLGDGEDVVDDHGTPALAASGPIRLKCGQLACGTTGAEWGGGLSVGHHLVAVNRSIVRPIDQPRSVTPWRGAAGHRANSLFRPATKFRWAQMFGGGSRPAAFCLGREPARLKCVCDRSH